MCDHHSLSQLFIKKKTIFFLFLPSGEDLNSIPSCSNGKDGKDSLFLSTGLLLRKTTMSDC